jgi:hypothetical protein
MKRSFFLKLVLAWCGLYAIMLIGRLANAARHPFDWQLIVDLIPSVTMVCGWVGLYQRKQWAAWVCAGTLAWLTFWLPLGYLRIASLPGKDPNRLLVTFSVWTVINVAVIAYLVILGYRDCCKKIYQKRDTPVHTPREIV